MKKEQEILIMWETEQDVLRNLQNDFSKCDIREDKNEYMYFKNKVAKSYAKVDILSKVLNFKSSM